MESPQLITPGKAKTYCSSYQSIKPDVVAKHGGLPFDNGRGIPMFKAVFKLQLN
jgi:hypothetical protein